MQSDFIESRSLGVQNVQAGCFISCSIPLKNKKRTAVNLILG